MPDDASIDASVAIGPIPQGFGIAVKLAIALPGLNREIAQQMTKQEFLDLFIESQFPESVLVEQSPKRGLALCAHDF